jgi:hypothetical protein
MVDILQDRCLLPLKRMFRLLNDGESCENILDAIVEATREKLTRTAKLSEEDSINVNTARTPEKGAHSPSWPNGLIAIIIIIIDIMVA